MTPTPWTVLNTAANRIANQAKLRAECPKEFMTYDNPWTQYALHLGFHFYPSDGWEWKPNISERESEREQVLCVLDSFSLSSLEKNAIGGWMLSQILESVPTRPSST